MFAERFRFHLESDDFVVEPFHLVALEGREAIGELFSFTVECQVARSDDDVEASALLGTKVCVVTTFEGLEIRRFHGIVASVHDKLEPTADYRSYRLRIAPQAHHLCLVHTQDIYQDTTVPDIVLAKLRLCGLAPSATEMRLGHKYAQREFVVQYRETDAAFVSRLCEHLGISFFFEHEAKGEKIVFTDHADGFRSLGEARFNPAGDFRDVYLLELDAQLVPSTCIVYDYNYRMPLVPIIGSAELPGGGRGGMAEYGCHAKTPEESEHLALVRSEEQQSKQQVYLGASDKPSFYAGGALDLTNHARMPEAQLLLTEVKHQATQPPAGRSGDASYRNTFRAVPRGFCYRPARVTPRPRIDGLSTGIVEPGPGGSADLAHIDTEGRYTIRFLFDTAPSERQKASRPVRMAQPHAGAGYGMHFPLKPGIEVVMAFIDGDPDRPIIVGSVPNPLTPSPVVSKNLNENAIRTASGARIRIIDR
ncbi:MAG: type VI secretion system tip protein VgrG [Polyangiaceae bacterium]|nr:type VI secretion system tip protein VgrG [Polyangiaceae bacterium]